MRCLLIDDIHQNFIDELNRVGIETDYRPDITGDEARKIIHEYEGLMVRSKMEVNQKDLDAGKKLKFIARAGAGVDHIDQDAVAAKGIKLLSAAEGNMDAVGEHAVGLLLALINNLVRSNNEVKSFAWKREENRGLELSEMTVGIVGYGNMGSAFAKRLRSFGCTVIAYDKYKTGFGDEFVKEVGVEELQERIDVLSLHVPLQDCTQYLFNSEFLSKIKKSFWLINTSRGPVVDLRSVIDGIKSGKIKGAGLDVLENEKFNKLSEEDKQVYRDLFAYDRVILSPHVAGWTVESYRKIAEVLAQKVVNWYKNK